MADDERLREALLELQLLREREAQSREDIHKLLFCLERFSAAEAPREALETVFLSLRHKIGASASVLGEIEEDGRVVVVASDVSGLKGNRIAPPFDLGDRSRNIVDLSLTGPWGGDLDVSAYSALQAAPTSSDGGRYVLVALKATHPPFEKGSLKLLERMVGLALQAHENSKIAGLNTLLAAAIQGSSSGFAIADATKPERPLIYVNQAFEKISGYEASEVLGENCRFLSAEPKGSDERNRLREAVKDNTPGQFLVRNRRKDGSLFWNELTLFPVKNDSGKIDNVVATQNDVSARIEAAEERDRTRAQMARALTATEDAFLVLEPGFVVAFANDATRSVFSAPGVDWSPGSTFQKNWKAYIEASRDLPGRITGLVARPNLYALAQLPNGREIDLPDGRTVLVRASTLSDDGVVLSATDVTAMRSAQRLLTQRLAAIEAAQDGIAVTDDAGRFTYLNGAAAALLGYTAPMSALGRSWHALYDVPEDIRDQREFDATLVLTGTGVARTHEVTGTVLDAGGSVIVFRDITDRLAFEAREADLKAGIQRLQRREATAQLTAGIAHDFNNLLSSINGSATLLDLSKDLPEALRAHVERISKAGNQAARLVNRLLDIDADTGGQGTFDLRSAASDIPTLVEPSLPDNITLTMHHLDKTVALKGDPGALSQVIVNLVLNARDALANGGGKIDVRFSRAVDRGDEQVQLGELLASQAYVRIDVADTGDGINPATLKAVFEPYFSTKGRHGSGLGLAMVAIQAQGIGGAVGITSTVGEGTTVYVYWPIASGGFDDEADQATGNHDLSGTTVIMVDDDADVAAVAAKYLEAKGAEVAVCIDPQDALEAIEDDPQAWSAIVTDYDMPKMNGGVLAENIKRCRPDIPVVLVTALARRLSDPRVNDGTIDVVLAKPTNLSHLAAVLYEYKIQSF